MNFQDKLQNLLRNRRIAIALSGGLDSATLLAFCADKLGNENCLALTVNTPYMMAKETQYAESLAKNLGVKFLKVEVDVAQEILKNPKERCYICKKFLFEKLKEIATQNGFTLADGTNFDDTKDYRPGMRALKELGVLSPFLECAVSKKEIRELAKFYNLEVAKKPAYACLLTRFEHDKLVTSEMLRRVDEAEEFLQNLGFNQVRVRVHNDVARIEIAQEKFEDFLKEKDKIYKALIEFDFKFVALDLNGYKQGAMNEKA